jgi:hypothetical protein
VSAVTDIERLYGKRKPVAARTPLLSPSSVPIVSPTVTKLPQDLDGTSETNPFEAAPSTTSRLDLDNKYFQKELMIFKHFDAFRYVLLAYDIRGRC